MLPCSQRALIFVFEHVGNFGVRLLPGCSRQCTLFVCSDFKLVNPFRVFVRVLELAGDARQWWQLGLCLCSLTMNMM